MGLGPMHSADSEGEFRPTAEINMTPFVDVMLVLLVIFMVATPLMMSGVPLQLPKSAAAKLTPPAEPLVVSVDAQGAVYIGDEAVADALLNSRLAALAAANPDRIVHVRGDRTLSYGRILEVTGMVSASGLRKVTLVARAEPAAR